MATRQVGDETLSPRDYDLVRSAYQGIMRWGLERTEARVRQRVAGAAGPDEMLDAVFVDPEQNREFYDGVAAGGLRVEARCHESLRALLGAGR